MPLIRLYQVLKDTRRSLYFHRTAQRCTEAPELGQAHRSYCWVFREMEEVSGSFGKSWLVDLIKKSGFCIDLDGPGGSLLWMIIYI